MMLAAALAWWLGATSPAPAFQDVHPVSGRRIAHVMGVGGADWLDRNERESEEHPDEALDALHLKAGMVVADVGAGTGYMTLRMAKRVGPGGKVYGEDVQPEMLRRLRENAAKARLGISKRCWGPRAIRNCPPGGST
jgi:predicted methyltransferase